MSETNRAVENEVWERRLRVLETCLGRSIMQYMHDDNVTEVMVNPDGRLWLDTFDKGVVPTDVVMEPEDTKRIIYMVASISGQVIDLKVDPSLQANIPASRLFSNCRFQAELPPIVNAPSFNIRKHSKIVITLDDYVRQGAMTEMQRQVILDAIHGKKNIIAAGDTPQCDTRRNIDARRPYCHHRGHERAEMHGRELCRALHDGYRRYGQPPAQDAASLAEPHCRRRGARQRSPDARRCLVNGTSRRLLHRPQRQCV